MRDAELKAKLCAALTLVLCPVAVAEELEQGLIHSKLPTQLQARNSRQQPEQKECSHPTTDYMTKPPMLWGCCNIMATKTNEHKRYIRHSYREPASIQPHACWGDLLGDKATVICCSTAIPLPYHELGAGCPNTTRDIRQLNKSYLLHVGQVQQLPKREYTRLCCRSVDQLC